MELEISLRDEVKYSFQCRKRQSILSQEHLKNQIHQFQSDKLLVYSEIWEILPENIKK